MSVARRPAATAAPRVRRAGPRDLDLLAALFGQLLAHHRGLGPAWGVRSEDAATEAARGWLGALLDDAQARVLCALDEAGPRGFCVARVGHRPPLFEETTRGRVDHLVVHPDARRRGHGRALVEAAAEWLRAQGATRLEISVARGNPEGAAFWRALGFRPSMDVLDRAL